MKKIIFILMVSSLFADKVVYQVDRKTKEGVRKINKEVEGEYLGVLDGKTYIRTNNEKLKEINCSDVIVVIDNNEKPIQFDCSENTFTPKTLNELDVKGIKKVYGGGVLITVGSIMLAVQTNNPPAYDNANEVDTAKTFTITAYLLIAMGGILLTIGL